MITNRTLGWFCVLGALLPASYAETQGPDTIRKKLAAEYQLTTVKYDKSGTVTIGSTVVLQKDKLLLLDAAAMANPCSNTYREGKIAQNTAGKVGGLRPPKLITDRLHLDAAPKRRMFVSGEKLYVTQIDIREKGKDAGITFRFYSDAIDDIHYAGNLLILFDGGTPSPDDALKLAQEVVAVEPADDAGR